MNPPSDDQFMRRAIALAMRGRGRVEPNPMVGCVIVKGGQVIGEGFHQQFGAPHAEPAALASCSQSPAGGTAYVTLEPCCHTNKKTPPCVPALIKAGLARIVAGCLDPNPMVNGQGLQLLQHAGISVDAGVLESECRQLAAPFIARVTYQRPYVTLKWAQTADGKVAGPGGQRMAISNAASSRLVHELRSRCDAILIGINTAISDNPLLTARGVATARPLLRCVLDAQRRLPADSQLIRTATEQSPVLIFCLPEWGTPPSPPAHTTVIAVEPDPIDPHRLSLRAVVEYLGSRAVTNLLVEPGPALARAFIEGNLADRLWVIRSAAHLDDATAPAAPLIKFPAVGELAVETDRLTEYLNPRSEVCFALVESADFVLARQGPTN